MFIKRIVEVMLIVLILILFGMLYVGRDQFKELLNKYNLLPRPETFTELYFENHQKLPSTLEPDKKYSFRFTTHNLEYKPMKYTYEVNAIASGSATLLDSDSFTLAHDSYKTLKGSFKTEDIHGRTQIQVTLTNKNQSIHFWVEAPPETIDQSNEQ